MEQDGQTAHVFSSPRDQDQHIDAEMRRCVARHGLLVLEAAAQALGSNESSCAPIWDGILCWDRTEAGSLAEQPCPRYFAGFDREDVATRRCLAGGRWFVHPQLNSTWTDYGRCFTASLATVVMNISADDARFFERYVPALKAVSRAGYCVSLGALLVAFCLMLFMRRLHCARNRLHMHLFASFMLRAAMVFLKDLLFIRGVGFPTDLLEKDGKSYFVDQRRSNNWACKLFTSLWQYCIAANYSWILMEGLYLHNLIMLARFSRCDAGILRYALLGWTLPALVVAPWAAARLLLDDTLCWTTHRNTSVFLIVRVPTMLSILINLVLFVNIARVLLSKLSSPVSEEARRYRRWARSTLVLVPLFGVHYALFLGMSYSIDKDQTVELVWLFCDQLFASFQGFFVAVLYCFVNGEVRAELRPHLDALLAACCRPACARSRPPGDSGSRGRASVCTTLSCSSLYGSAVRDSKRANPAPARLLVTHEQCRRELQALQPRPDRPSPRNSQPALENSGQSAELEMSALTALTLGTVE